MAVVNPPGHLWRDKWTALSGTLSTPSWPRRQAAAALSRKAAAALKGWHLACQALREAGGDAPAFIEVSEAC